MIKLVALLKRKPDMTQEEFARRWLHDHTKLSKGLPGLIEYRINIAAERQEGGGEPAYDGTAEMWWEDIETMEDAFASELGQRAGADADEFADVRIHVYTEEHVIVSPPNRG